MGTFGIKPISLGVLVASSLLLAIITPSLSQEKPPPYDAELLRLSEILGSMHFLSLICRPDDGQIWHEKMQEVLATEGDTPLQKAKLVERFNFGFSGFQSTYRKCTASASIALDRYAREGQQIVETLTTEFGR